MLRTFPQCTVEESLALITAAATSNPCNRHDVRRAVILALYPPMLYLAVATPLATKMYLISYGIYPLSGFFVRLLYDKNDSPLHAQYAEYTRTPAQAQSALLFFQIKLLKPAHSFLVAKK